MNTWLTEYKSKFQEQIFDLLWRQWSTLGIAGTLQADSRQIIDIEALLLFSLSVCRHEPRLFDEITDWLNLNGQFINVQRLQQIQNKYNFHCGPQLSAIAELLSRQSKYQLKWAGLAKKYYLSPSEVLFLDETGKPLPCPPDNMAQETFLRHGLKRGKFDLRGYSQSFDMQSPACLQLRLRAFLGVNARAEILCLLASEDEIQPNNAAARLSYYQKTIQTILLEMAQSGVILARTNKREKFYRLTPGILDSLLMPGMTHPQWLNWPDRFIIIEDIWLRLDQLTQMQVDDLLIFSELHIQLKKLQEKYPDSFLKKIDTARFGQDNLMAAYDLLINSLSH